LPATDGGVLGGLTCGAPTLGVRSVTSSLGEISVEPASFGLIRAAGAVVALMWVVAPRVSVSVRPPADVAGLAAAVVPTMPSTSAPAAANAAAADHRLRALVR
jgi:hypothetical protein